MKVILRAYSSVLLLSALALSSHVMAAGDPLVEKKKTYSKSYPLSSSDKVSLRNQFGEMKINTWDKNEVKVDVTIVAEAGTDDRAQRLLDAIQIQDSKDGGTVFFQTKIGNNNSGNRGKGERQSFNIDYVVYLPSGNKLDARNEFGPMTIGDYKGKIYLESKFGSLTTGNLTGDADVNVEFGKATIGSVSSGEVTIKFSKGIVQRLTGDVKANFEYSGVKVGIENNAKNVDIRNSYTQLLLDVNTNFSANWNISTSFSEVRNKTSFPIKKEGDDDEDHGPKFDFKYAGKSGNGSAAVKVKASFGDVTIGHNLPFDVNEEDKKDKKKTRNI
jgi:hypothetical protein